MRNYLRLIVLVAAAISLSWALPTPPAFADDEVDNGEEVEEEETSATTATPMRGGRMEFDARLIRGETAGTGAVFLFQRTPRRLPSMIDRRTSYLGNTVNSVLGKDWEETFETSKKEAE